MQFEQFFWRIFGFITRFCNKYLDFWKFAICFADYWSIAQGLSKNISNVLYLYYNKRGSQIAPPPREPIMKQDVKIIRVNNLIVKIITFNSFFYKISNLMSKIKWKLKILFVILWNIMSTLINWISFYILLFQDVQEVHTLFYLNQVSRSLRAPVSKTLSHRNVILPEIVICTVKSTNFRLLVSFNFSLVDLQNYKL